MSGKSVFVTLVLVFGISSAHCAEPPRLDLNDVTWLWPAPQLPDDLDRIVAIGSLKSSNGSPVWSDQQFEDLVTAAKSDATRVGNHQIQFPAAFEDKSIWRIAAFRADSSAPGGHQLIRENLGEIPQLRLILQPVTVNDGRIKVHDVAIHLVYSFLTGPAGVPPSLPDRERFRTIVRDLDALKKKSEEGGANTASEPLGVHPGLKADVPQLQAAVRQFFSDHLDSKRVSAMAIMGLDGPHEPWIFLALAKPPGGERFVPIIQLLPAQMINFRSGDGVVQPANLANNRNPITKDRFPDLKLRRGVTTAVLFGDGANHLDDFAIIGKNEAGEPVADDTLRNRDIPDLIANPELSHFFNTDCVSCHTETRRRLRLELTAGPFAYLRDGTPPRIAADVLPKDDWNVRNVGWFSPSSAIGGGPTVATVTQRTANETAEVVEFLEQHYRDVKTPVFLDQGWNEEQRHDFYFLGQGSQLVPYLWFLSLERAASEELLRSDRHMAALGFIPHAPKLPRNPDGLPIGFVKDSNPSSIAQKAGFLGLEFNRNNFPTTEDWLGLTCAACHTANLEHNGHVLRIEGGAALADVESFLAELAASMRATVDDDAKFVRFEKRLRGHVPGSIDTSGMRDELQSFTSVIQRLVDMNKATHPYGLARLDAFGAILNQICSNALEIPENRREANAPVSYPYLWDAPNLDWVQWNSAVASPIARNVGEVLGVFAHVQLTGTPAEGQFNSSARVDYLHRLETSLRELKAPKWPEQILGKIDTQKAQAGKVLFENNCADCHNMRDEKGQFRMTRKNEFGKQFIKTTSVPFRTIGTDPQMVKNFIMHTARPGSLAASLQEKLQQPQVQKQLRKLSTTIVALGGTAPDFTQELPRGMLLSAAVQGVLARDLGKRFANRTEAERRQLMLELNDLHGKGESTPNNGAGYKARPLNGVWATAPFGHAGAVPNLFQWLKPEKERIKSFHIGSRQFDAKNVGISTEEVPDAFHFQTIDDAGEPIPGNSNLGHTEDRQTAYTDDERWEIIEYLKTLQ